MKKELQDKLFRKYPKIFRQKDLSFQETAMCWGISCGDGWYDIIDVLCNQIKLVTDASGLDVEAVQVKSKWGGLRFYVDGPGVDERVRGMISMAEAISLKIKEETPKQKFYDDNMDVENDWDCTPTGEMK